MKLLSAIKILLPLTVIGLASCGKDEVADNNPYQNNPYYGPSGGSSYGGGDYGSATPAAPPQQQQYPTYNDSGYSPPAPSSGGGSYGAGSGGSSYTVAKGDTLFGISRRHGTSVAAIKSANGMGGDTIYPGQTLRIP